ncbi:MAG: hypothetical protein OEW77_09055 [Gemmatimonadota bacterium]|nr:hypothetical protein [Gemmatimonadota bacterium]
MSERKRHLLLPTRRGDPRASVVAFLLQLALIIVIVPTLLVPIAFDFLRDDSGRTVQPERISFLVSLPQGGPTTREAPKAGGDGRTPVASPTPAAPVVAPSTVPSAVPTPGGPPREAPGGVGPLVGGGGPTQGIRPSFNDRRLWSAPGDIVVAPLIPMTRADSLRTLLQETARLYVDSMVRANPQGRRPGDWTFERGGKKYGIDPQFIQLGDFKIPTALLALLPMNVQANPTGLERARRLSSMRSEIIEQAERRARDDDFYAAVKALRERKEREREEAAAKKAADPVVPPARP